MSTANMEGRQDQREVEHPASSSSEQSASTAPLQPPGMSAVMMPWFMGASWVAKFSGEKGTVEFNQWQAQVESFLRAQALQPRQKVDFMLSALGGQAHREAMLLPQATRDSDQGILRALAAKYGDHRSSETLQVEYFNCRQAEGEIVEDFTLRLRECFDRWRRSEPDYMGEEDGMLRSQFARGLREGPVKRELQRHLRRNPRASFSDVHSEARSLEREELGSPGKVMACQARTTPVTQPPTPDELPLASLQQLKDSLRAELKQELHDQVALLGKTIADELRSQLQLPQRDSGPARGQPASGPASAPRRRTDNRGPRSYQWDEQGRPICQDCGEAGHIQRYCPRRSASQPGFRPSRSLQGE